MDTLLPSSNPSEDLQPEATEASATALEVSSIDYVSKQQLEPKQPQIEQQISTFLSQFPNTVSEFLKRHQQAISNTFLALASLVAIKVILSIIDSLNDVPFLSTILQLIGLGYSIWFSNRYLLKAQTRRELLRKIQGTQEDIYSPSSNFLNADVS
jgi:hypothetical protein